MKNYLSLVIKFHEGLQKLWHEADFHVEVNFQQVLLSFGKKCYIETAPPFAAIQFEFKLQTASKQVYSRLVCEMPEECEPYRK
jgi:hypothetical protein